MSHPRTTPASSPSTSTTLPLSSPPAASSHSPAQDTGAGDNGYAGLRGAAGAGAGAGVGLAADSLVAVVWGRWRVRVRAEAGAERVLVLVLLLASPVRNTPSPVSPSSSSSSASSSPPSPAASPAFSVISPASSSAASPAAQPPSRAARGMYCSGAVRAVGLQKRSSGLRSPAGRTAHRQTYPSTSALSSSGYGSRKCTHDTSTAWPSSTPPLTWLW
jgi:hypothetical protein